MHNGIHNSNIGFDIIRKDWINRLCILRSQIFCQVAQTNRSNTVVLRGFFWQAGGKYASKMCKQFSA